LDQSAKTSTVVAKRIDEHLGERIRERRTHLGLTQEQLASALQISYQQVQKYETGANRVSAGRLYEIAVRLDVDVNFFFEGLSEASKSEQMPHGGRNRAVIELARNFSEIKEPQVRSAVASLVKILSAQTQLADSNVALASFISEAKDEQQTGTD